MPRIAWGTYYCNNMSGIAFIIKGTHWFYFTDLMRNRPVYTQFTIIYDFFFFIIYGFEFMIFTFLQLIFFYLLFFFFCLFKFINYCFSTSYTWPTNPILEGKIEEVVEKELERYVFLFCFFFFLSLLWSFFGGGVFPMVIMYSLLHFPI